MFYYHKGLTRAARHTVGTALTLAGRQGCAAADTGHILLAMLQTARGPAVEFLRRKNITITALRACSEQRACAGHPVRLHGRDLAPESRKALEFAVLGAHAARAARAENEHLLCAMLEDANCTASVWLSGLGVELPRAARECRQLSGQLVLPATPRMSTNRGSKPSEKYGRDLTRLAQEGRLDPVLCRDAELDRMIEILCRRQKNNPCLLGEPGVGKSALAEALAQRIASGQITQSLKGKRVLSLDMASMVAGTKYRGDFEERFKNLLEELYRDRSTILFIDEIHVIAGAGAAEGAIDAASILKPMLARGEIQLIGATTPEEYRKTIQKDSALDRRFGKVIVEEPTPAQAEQILAGLMPRYERYHGVRIPAQAIHSAVELSVRYLPGRYLPDKAIDLLDEAAAALRIAGGEHNGEKAPTLTTTEIARVVGAASGVPAERVGEAERERLEQLEPRLAEQVIGQPRAVHAVAAAIRRSRTGLREAGRPIGALLFLGPTGVGKTQLARTLAKSWFGSEKALLRFDMSEYMEQHTVARLIGSPPGYVGHDEGGQLTEAVRRRPYSVVLFDEIEKAHGDIQNILLQILEDGCLTDAQGRKADFSNTIILLTSNLGARCLAGQSSPLGFGSAEEELDRRGKKALQEARDYFRPELMGRLDEVVLFDPLGPAQLTAIADRLLQELEERAAQQGYTLHHTAAVAAALAGRETPAYGARELRRKVSRAVEQALADRIAAGTARPGMPFVADVDPATGKIVLTTGDFAACV
ncbi:MAG: ATP-dependent Clp protease ATP-binding subunit [Gemmiger sp.]|uniref:ATP-dependent Clp protease ATP-binding subunit n=1 Tax=Gemmiger sp. TaxID=2049027 RepID=UPI002E78B4A0|nr:ATP-dependent Clp protease ATP-binding subunit [Gemmiger sp.]MEE0801479.1 ATP-dependent Clp protease ATP-binding subunit [Gemmiger sp.]